MPMNPVYFKPTFLLIVFFLSVCDLKSQSLPRSDFQLELKDEPGPQKIDLTFSTIKVLDKRFDSSKLGYLFFRSSYKNITLKSSLSAAMEEVFRKNFLSSNNSDRTLCIVIRTLWMHDLKSGEVDVEDFNNEMKNISKYILKADVYSFQNNTYQALTRIDTSFESKSSLKEIGYELLNNSFTYMAHRISSLNLEELFSRKTKINESDVMNYYEQRFKKPRIQHDTLSRGIYLTFADFLNNHPRPYKFSLQQDEQSDYLYIEENGQEKLFTDFWGFSDGENLYLRLGFNFFKLIRDNNTYSLWGCLQAVHTTPSRNKNRVVRYMAFGNLANIRSAKLSNVLRPMQLDMETGIAY